MNMSRGLLVLTMLTAITARAAEWPPIAPEVWALKEDPAKGIKDAVILEDRTIFHSGSFEPSRMERRLRIRVLSETGRKAAHLGNFPEACSGFDGQTVYPGGKVVAFNKRQDFLQEESKLGDSAEKRTVLIPPGVTGNCVVELRWIEPTYGWSPLPVRDDNYTGASVTTTPGRLE